METHYEPCIPWSPGEELINFSWRTLQPMEKLCLEQSSKIIANSLVFSYIHWCNGKTLWKKQWDVKTFCMGQDCYYEEVPFKLQDFYIRLFFKVEKDLVLFKIKITDDLLDRE